MHVSRGLCFTSDLMTKLHYIAAHLGKHMELLLARVDALEKHAAIIFIYCYTFKREEKYVFLVRYNFNYLRHNVNVRKSFIAAIKKTVL